VYEVWGIYEWNLRGWANQSQEWVRGDEALYKSIEQRTGKSLIEASTK